LKTSSSTACYKTVAYGKCAVDYTILDRDVLNQNRKCEQKSLDTFEKSKKTVLMKSATTITKMKGAMMRAE